MINKEKILILGYIKKPHALKGAVLVICKGELLATLEKPAEVNIYRADKIRDGFLINPLFTGTLQILSMKESRPENYLVQLKGVHTIEEAEAYRGVYFGIGLNEARELFSTPEDPYLFEYVDLEVLDQKGNFLGRVERVESSGYAEWIVINTEKGEKMIPLESEYFQNIDYENNRIVMTNTAILDDID